MKYILQMKIMCLIYWTHLQNSLNLSQQYKSTKIYVHRLLKFVYERRVAQNKSSYNFLYPKSMKTDLTFRFIYENCTWKYREADICPFVCMYNKYTHIHVLVKTQQHNSQCATEGNKSKLFSFHTFYSQIGKMMLCYYNFEEYNKE